MWRNIMKKTWKYGILLIGVVLVFALLARALNPISPDRLINAIEQEDVEEVRRLLEKGADPNEPGGITNPFLRILSETSPDRPLSVACETGNLEVVKLLISYGATVEYQKGMGWSPLAATLREYQPDDIEMVKLLLENGADISQRETGWLPVYRASLMAPKKFDKATATGSVYSTGYDEETAKGITEIVKLLMGDFDINDQDENPTTLLMNAALMGNRELVEYLLSIGADPTLIDARNKTAYDYAVEHGHTEIAEMLSE
ncbi:MAG: hypothetical protein E7629_01090 [Ruminococcaceae bacterium]|nr:hypothetical protein [Oscillospiraceae bacterium]